MAVPRLEAELLAPVARHYARAGYAVRREVPVNGRVADVLALRGDELVAVELKLRDWRQALRQAIAYQVGAPLAYVAVPLDTALTLWSRRSPFARAGVGLLAVHGEGEDAVRELLPATPSGRHLPFVAEGLRKVFARGRDAGSMHVLVACPDLLFRSRILAACRDAGVTPVTVQPAELEARAGEAALAFLDLDLPGAVEHAARATSKGLRVVGFGSHKDVALLTAARAAGVEAMARSAFVERVGALAKEAA